MEDKQDNNGNTFFNRVYDSIGNFILPKLQIIFYLNKNISKNKSDEVFYDKVLLFAILSLFTFGLLMVFSSSISSGNPNNIFNPRMAVAMFIPVLMFIIFLNISSDLFNKNNIVLLIIISTIALLLLVNFIGISVKGAKRWINFFGFSFQPAETAKLTMLIYLSYYIVRVGHSLKTTRKLFLDSSAYVVVTVIIAFLLALQPDFGTTLTIIVISIVVFVTNGASILVILVSLVLLIILVLVSLYTSPYLAQRISSFWNPFDDPFGAGYQLVNSLTALGRGDIFGLGLGNSVSKLSYLPEANTDYIFAIVGEELGFFGIFLVIALYIIILVRMLKISYESIFKYDRKFQGILVISFFYWFAYQALYNILMVIGFFPTDGATLPLISYGGSSYLHFLISLSICLRIDYENRCLNYDKNILKTFN